LAAAVVVVAAVVAVADIADASGVGIRRPFGRPEFPARTQTKQNKKMPETPASFFISNSAIGQGLLRKSPSKLLLLVRSP
jgi:hypothetical protein